MSTLRESFVWVALAAALALGGTQTAEAVAAGQNPGASATPQAAQQPPAQPQQQPPPKPEEKPEEMPAEPPTYEETVVVTATKVETALVNAPATVSVISSETIQATPTQGYAELLRAVPGTNVSQTSARDLNITSRGATSTLSTSQLALLDGRSLYLDFFGFVAWDFLPVNLAEVKQIEVIRGPASAIWGANALTGVVNIITKSPREMQGTSVTIGFGGFDRDVEGSDKKLGTGTLFYVNGTHAGAPNDRWSYKLSAGAFTQDAFARPTGNVPNDFNTPYPAFSNTGTTQPKFDARVDYDAENGSRLVMAGGLAGTEGIIHTGIGPFDIQSGSVLGYAKVNWNKGPLRVNGFVNLLDGQAPALLSVDASTGKPVQFSFDTQTYDFEVGNVQAIGTTHVLSYGGNIRRNNFTLSIAPRGNNRSEGGMYIQDEIFLGDYFRWLVGTRVDWFSVLKNEDGDQRAVFSPRTTFMIKPGPEHTFRVSYNRAYRAPSLINNFLELTIVNELNLGLIDPRLNGVLYRFPVQAVGNEDLVETSLDAYEVGYTGVINNRASVSFAFYVNDTKDDIFFTQVDSYTSANPPPGWPLPPIVLDLLILRNAFGPGNGLPSHFSYVNLGKTRNKGIELGLDLAVNRYVNAYANYSYQADPIPTDFDISELNLPANNRFNIGFNADYGRYLGNLSVSYTDDAYWQDVLDARFHGPTKSFTLVNGGFGVRLARERVTASVKVTNLFNVDAQQHVFGDILKRQIAGELRFNF